MGECSAQPFQVSDEAQPGLRRGKGIENIMRFRMLGVGVALLAVFAFGAMAVASSAMANEVVCIKVANTGLYMKRSTAGVCEELLAGGKSEFELVEFLLAEFLENSISITETMLVETIGELLLENEKAPIAGKAAAVCSLTAVGDIGPDGADDITEMLNLSKELVGSLPLSGTGLSCADETTCESAKVWPVGLPWLSLLQLWETLTPAESGFVTLLTSQKAGTNIGWYVECTVIGVKVTEECTTAMNAFSAENVAEGILGTFSTGFTELMGLKLALCSTKKEESGVVTGSVVTVTSLTGPLTVSE
jgi:hypothetical protein